MCVNGNFDFLRVDRKTVLIFDELKYFFLLYNTYELILKSSKIFQYLGIFRSKSFFQRLEVRFI